MRCQAEREVVMVANQAMTNLHSAKQKRASRNPVHLSIYCELCQLLLIVCLDHTTLLYKLEEALPVFSISRCHPARHYHSNHHVKARYL